MGGKTGITWTDHTFNAWWGCAKVSAGCAHCYADTFQRRYQFDVFGYEASGERKPLRTFGDKHWSEPVKWDRDAQQAGVRRRVFCASMADVFDDHPDTAPLRARLFALIRSTPHLDWQLLTKRPENILHMLPDDWDDGYPNVWLGTSVENDVAGEKRVPLLLQVPAKVRFLSCEPLLEDVSLTWDMLYRPQQCSAGCGCMFPREADPLDCACDGECTQDGPFIDRRPDLHWVIIGGESGHGARRLDPAWVDRLIAQCDEYGIPAFMKQTGVVLAREMNLSHSKGEDPAEWPARWQRQEFPA